jgi:cytosine/adenosine deaminase-related metal-dependent hydrolase
MSIYIKNVTYIDWDTFKIINGNIKVDEGDEGGISFIDTVPETAYNGSGKVITKSFVCAHHHAYSALARGMPAPKKPPQNFTEILEYIWWNLDKKLDAEMIQASALVTAMACARNGTTFVIDHHASPFAIPGCLEIIAEAFEKIGINHLLCYEMSDRDGEKIREEGLAETTSYLEKREGLVGLHASFTVSDRLLNSAVELCEKHHSGIHIHVAEDGADERHAVDHYNMRVINRLNSYGFLRFPKAVLAHCIHLDEEEREILANSNAWIAINTESNLNNNVGIFSNSGGLEDKVLLGTDGMHSDMIRNTQINYFIHKDRDQLHFDGCYKRLRRAHHYLKTNQFKGDADNNLIVFDYTSPTPILPDNWLGHFYYGLTSADINGTICNGKWIFKDRDFVNIDQNEILAFSQKQATRLWERLV